MYQKSDPRGDSPVSIIGAGIAGAWQALLVAQAGHAVTLYERSDADMTLSTSHWAGGMLAPWCEAETSEPVIGRLGIRIAVEPDGTAGGFDAGMQFGQHLSRLDMAFAGIEQAIAETAVQRRFEIA